MSNKSTYISLLYRNEKKITERIDYDEEIFKKLTVGNGCQLFSQEGGSLMITLEDVIFAKISAMASSLTVGELLIEDKNYQKELEETFDMELLFDNGAIEVVKNINIKYRNKMTSWKPKDDFVIRLINKQAEMFYFNTKDIIYIKYIEFNKNKDLLY